MGINELTKDKLVPCLAIKANLTDECYVVNIVGTEKIALLPREKAQKIYRVGDPFFAVVEKADMVKTYLTQKSQSYVYHIVLGALSYLKKPIQIKDIAYIQNAGFCKVAVDTNEDLKEVAKKCTNYFMRHLNINIALIKYSTDIKEYIINALAPAPPTVYARINIYPAEQRAELYVPQGLEGIVLGPDGKNVASAAKLTKFSLQVITANA